MTIYNNILETIGRTPVVKMNRISEDTGANIFGKLEMFNPAGSVKDRIGLAMIQDAEQKGQLKPGDTIVEPTSGNTGIALAMVAVVKGYKAVFTMPDTMSVERRALLGLFGAEIVLTEGAKGMKGAIEKAAELVREKGYFQPQQFDNPANPKIHRETTGQEIIEDFKGIDLNYFVVGVGTGGTISGAGDVLKNHFKNLKNVAVEPVESPVLSGGDPGPHKIQGIGAGFVPGIYNKGVVDEVRQVSSIEAFDMARRLAKDEGIFCGISSGANVHAALQIAKEAGPEKNVLVVLPDTGERYISTDLFKLLET
ncbi:MAG: cysteine synthase A [Candidatus Scalindua sp. AMX11]|nr:MAG: cysteine synthase A [Candidatus Scalindua sp.]NOG84590.1 cysteine synthase A [Planctomycetota bacterium]RZV92364.1 MAG: cysteine synthase A [Candidatus Scalindua sp. SCAELEC01]TDE66111.1 MAG: cysteine synthase A [Candidatus Scalindua sp. AMX11]GJQ59084.1 MAG: cysteine synthase [Candidatus Scalindua sp.]